MNARVDLNGASLMLMDPMPEHGYPAVPPQAFNLHLHVEALQQDVATLGLPEPLRQRIQVRLTEHRKALAEHESSRPMTIPRQNEERE